MSGRSCASGSVRSAAGSLRQHAPTAHELVLDALYERKRDNKSVRVLTVVVYVFCVSLAAIMLSLYYVFFWEPKDAQRKVAHKIDLQTSTTPKPTCLTPHTTGGSNISMNESSPVSPFLSSTAADPEQEPTPPSRRPSPRPAPPPP